MPGLISGTQGALTINTADVADDAITLAKMAPGTDGQILTYDASGNISAVGPGSDGQVLTSTGAGSPPAFETLSAGFTLASEQATTSGSSVTFGSIPAGTKMIVVNLIGVSTNGTGGCGVQIGDAGGLETSGYVGRATTANGSTAVVNFSDHFEFTFLNAADNWYGQFRLTLGNSSHAWACSFQLGRDQQDVWDGAGGKTLSGELTQVALRTDNTFDAGSASIMYI